MAQPSLPVARWSSAIGPGFGSGRCRNCYGLVTPASVVGGCDPFGGASGSYSGGGILGGILLPGQATSAVGTSSRASSQRTDMGETRDHTTARKREALLSVRPPRGTAFPRRMRLTLARGRVRSRPPRPISGQSTRPQAQFLASGAWHELARCHAGAGGGGGNNRKESAP